MNGDSMYLANLPRSAEINRLCLAMYMWAIIRCSCVQFTSKTEERNLEWVKELKEAARQQSEEKTIKEC